MEWLSEVLEDIICDEAPHSEVIMDEFKEQEDIYYAIALSLSEQDQKGKKSIDKESQSEEYKQLARAQTKEDEHITKAQLEDDEQLAEALQEIMYMESPPHCETENIFQPHPFNFPSEYRICARCKTEIGRGEFLTCMDADWHPECFRCHACNCPITDSKFYISGNRSYHKLCYRKQRLPRCEVCKNFIPASSKGRIPYMEHPFWKNKYCPHMNMMPRDTRYLLLDDGRKLCLECLNSAIMDTEECQPLYLEIQEFYEGLNMKVEQQVPMLLVERQALNEAMEGEKHGHHHLSETRGLCLSEVQTVPTVRTFLVSQGRPRIGANHQLDIRTEPCRLIRRCEVTAILVLYGLPRY
ncbi:hypothetical protein I3760_Q021400 [Carya illinoinensis]|nr:hypothetical protein I3760_Q021400 [Carya illinoinensis]